MITKVYFPRLLVAVAPVVSYLVDMLLGFSILIGMMFYYHVYPDPARVLAVVPLTLLALVAATGVGLWLSALNVRYRDVRFVVPFFVQLWMIASAVIYPLSAARHTIYGINPMISVVEGFRWALLDAGSVGAGALLLSSGVALLLLLSGAYTFRRLERSFADVV
jgi:lipopolysaccharide transport system permease protein